RLGEVRSARERREGIMAVLVELIGTRSGDERHFSALGHFARDQSERAGKAAVNRRKLIAVDQTVGLGARDGGVALHIRDDQVELGAAERFDAAGIVDHLHRELGGIDAALADLGHASGDRVKAADVDGFCCPRAQRKRGKCRGSKRAARGLGEKVSAALSLLRCPTPAVFHRHLPWRLSARYGASPDKSFFAKRLRARSAPLRSEPTNCIQNYM